MDHGFGLADLYSERFEARPPTFGAPPTRGTETKLRAIDFMPPEFSMLAKDAKASADQSSTAENIYALIFEEHFQVTLIFPQTVWSPRGSYSKI